MADKPPAYSELQPMIGGLPSDSSPTMKDKESNFKFNHGGGGPSAPLLPANEAMDTLSRFMSAFPNTIMLKADSAATGQAQTRDEFFLRDSVDILLAKGEVSKPTGQRIGFNQITVQGQSNGENLLEINCENGNCTVFHRNTKIGALTLDPSVPQSLSVTQTYDNIRYSVDFSSTNDLTVSKGTGTGAELLCKIHIPTEVRLPPGARIPGYIRRYTEVRFDGTLAFSDNIHVTPLDKFMCISLVLVFVAARNDITTKQAGENTRLLYRKLLKIFIGSFIAVLIVGLLLRAVI